MFNKDCLPKDTCQEKICAYLAILAALLSGFFLFALEQVIFWPFIFEEIVKASIIFFFILKIDNKTHKILLSLAVWLVFILVENIFYLPQFIAQDNLSLFYARFIGPSILHLITFSSLLLFSWSYKYLIIFALIINIFLHYYFNLGIIHFF